MIFTILAHTNLSRIGVSILAFLIGSPVLTFLAGCLFSIIICILFLYIRKKRRILSATLGGGLFDEYDQIKTLIDHLPNSVYIKDTSCKYVLTNKNYSSLLKKEQPGQLTGKSDFDFYTKEDAQKYYDEDQRVLKSEIPQIQREQHSLKKGKDKYTITTKVPLKNAKGKIIGLVGVCSDITDQKASQTKLEEKNLQLDTERKLLRTLIDNMPDTIYIKDTEGKFLDGNSEQISVTKAESRQNLIGKTDFDFYPKDIAEIYHKDELEILATGKAILNKEEIGLDEKGNIRMRSTSKVPFLDENGKISGIVGIGRDISELKNAEEKLKEQAQSLQEINVLLEERQEEINQQTDELNSKNSLLEEEKNLLRTLIDHMPDFIYVKDRNSTFLTANKFLLDVMHADSLESIKGKSDFDYYPKDLASKFFNDEQQIIRTGKAMVSEEESSIDIDGNIMYQLTTKVPFKNADGEIMGIIGIGRDITSIKESEMMLIEQSENLQEANVLLEERQEEIQQQSQELKSQNNILENERNLLRTLIDYLPDFIYIKDKESRFITCNRWLLEVLKAPNIEMVEGKTDFDFYPREFAKMYYDDEQNIIKSGKAIINKQEIGYDSKGNERIISTSKVPFMDSDGRILGVVGIGRDITELKDYEKKLELQTDNLKEINFLLEERQEEVKKQSKYLSEQNILLESERNLLRTLIDNMPDHIYIKDKESKFITLNKKLMKVMGAETLDAIIGKTDFDFTIRNEITESYFHDEQKILKTGKAIINKEEIGYDEQGRERIMSTTKVPFMDVDGNIAGLVGIGRDISRQKNAEKQLREQTVNLQEVNILLEERQEKIQQQAEELNKQADSLKLANSKLEQLNATKNKFFSIIAHDLKNPFQAIFGFSELLMRNFTDFDENQRLELLTMIKSSSEGAYNLLENLLQWARTQTDRIKYHPIKLDIEEVIEQNINLCKAGAENKNITLVAELSCSKNVYADKNMINLVIRNILSNAIKFTEPDGQVTARCFDSNDKEITIAISDTGTGISKDNINKLFRIDEYFSTSGTAGESGTGLGLIICNEFIEKNKGELTVDSEIGIGTTFSFTLPIKA